jgi:hypothetical protein
MTEDEYLAGEFTTRKLISSRTLENTFWKSKAFTISLRSVSYTRPYLITSAGFTTMNRNRLKPSHTISRAGRISQKAAALVEILKECMGRTLRAEAGVGDLLPLTHARA